MDQSTVKYWRFLNTVGFNSNHVMSSFGEYPKYMTDHHGMLTIEVNWIDGKPYYKGQPGSECTHDGNLLAVKGTGLKPPTGLQASSPWDTQVGGTHYTDCKIQPFEYSMANGLDPMRHTIVKYVTRKKNGIQDLEKARHVLDLLIAWEKKNATANT